MADGQLIFIPVILSKIQERNTLQYNANTDLQAKYKTYILLFKFSMHNITNTNCRIPRITAPAFISFQRFLTRPLNKIDRRNACCL